jgi:hypothetical protein
MWEYSPVRTATLHDTASRTTVLAAIGLLAGSFLALHGLNRLTVDIEFLRIGEQSLWTWVTCTLFAASALTAFGFMALQPPAARWPWATVGALMLALSADEVAAVHERLEEASSELSFFVLQPLIALAAVVLFVRLIPALERDARIWIGLAAAALVLAQLGSTVVTEREVSNAVHVGQAIAEELLEMLVPAFILAATLPAVWPRVAAGFDPGNGRWTDCPDTRPTP